MTFFLGQSKFPRGFQDKMETESFEIFTGENGMLAFFFMDIHFTPYITLQLTFKLMTMLVLNLLTASILSSTQY